MDKLPAPKRQGPRYRTLESLMTAKDNGELPAGFLLILDDDDVSSTIVDSLDNEHTFSSDPHSLLRELLDYVGLEYDEC